MSTTLTTRKEWATMTNVSKECLQKVQEFFVERVKTTGRREVEATVIEIAEGSGVALATAHKAIKELSRRGVIKIIKPQSRRVPLTYVYLHDIEDFVEQKTKEEQIEYLQKMLIQAEEEIQRLRRIIHELTANGD